MISLVSPDYNFQTFCNHMLGKNPRAIVEIATGEISYAQRLHRETTQESDFRKGSRGWGYCDNLRKLIWWVINGTVPTDATPEFLAVVKPLIQQLLQNWDLGKLRKTFSGFPQPDDVDKDDFLVKSGADWIAVVVSRDEVERLDLSGCLQVLNSLIENPERALRFRGRVDFGVHGYDDDPRELFEIPEVRTFIRELDTKWPHWFFFLSKVSGALGMIMLSLCRYQRVGAGQTRYDPRDFELFMCKHFDALNWIFDRFGFNEALNEEISEAIGDYFASSGKA